MKVRVHLFPTVIYNQTFSGVTMEQAARRIDREFNGFAVNFGKGAYAEELGDFITATPLDAKGQPVPGKTQRFALNDLENLDSDTADCGHGVRVSLYPTVRYSEQVEAPSREEAAMMVVQNFNGHAVDFGEGQFDDQMTDLVIMDPINANGRIIFSESLQMKLAQVDALISEALADTADEEEMEAPGR